jgi:hypothetical protein
VKLLEKVMRNLTHILAMVLALLSLTACSQMDTMRIGQDKPEDLEPLVASHEYARARQLTGKYPALDTLETQAWITAQESEYEATVFAEARKLESENDLLGAVTLLSGALQKLPHSTLLRELRNGIEQERVEQLKANERKQLVSRAAFMLEQQQLYANKVNLESPSFSQRWENKRNAKEALELSSKLLEHGQYAMQNDRLDIAMECLQLSTALNPTDEADNLISEINTTRESRKQVEIKKASIKKAKKRRKVKQKQKDMTRVLVEETQLALAKHDLHAARAAYVQIPASSLQHSEVIYVRDKLDDAIKRRVDEILVAGDAQYRADQVLEAVRTWTEGLSLDPENPELRERVERANRVLAKLEQLKRQQPN